MLFIGTDPGSLRPYFSNVRMLTADQNASVWLCMGRRLPWADLWPRLRTLSVG